MIKSLALAGLLGASLAVSASAAEMTHETVVFLRHGEKPVAGLGQLDCRGLNRALALPTVLTRRFGTPVALFAPNPGLRKNDGGNRYNYIRPLATLEPTAIALGMPINVDHGLDDSAGLEAALAAPELRNGMVWVAWEHHVIERIAKDLLRDNGGAPEQVPTWQGDDFDSLWIVSIDRDGTSAHAHLNRTRQGLDGQSARCPLQPQ